MAIIIVNIKHTQTHPLRNTVTAYILTRENTKYNNFVCFKKAVKGITNAKVNRHTLQKRARGDRNGKKNGIKMIFKLEIEGKI